MKRILLPLFLFFYIASKSQCASDSANALSFPYSFGSSCTALVQSTASEKAEAYFLRALCIKNGLPYSLTDCASNTDSVLAYSFPYVPGTGCSILQMSTMGERAEVFFLHQLLSASGSGSGTVTSIATGYGVKGGTITTSGTISVDTISGIGSAKLATEYYASTHGGSGNIKYWAQLPEINADSAGAVVNVPADTVVNRNAIQACLNL